MTPLLHKLGWREGMNAAVSDRPDGLAAALPLPEGTGPADLAIVFVANRAAIPAAVAACDTYRDGTRLWFAYPKKSGARAADIDRDRGWEPVEALGFLPVTQVALDADWSALRWRRRHEIPKLTRRGEVARTRTA
jgi:hypothetical protein